MSAVVEPDHLSRNEILDRVDVLHAAARRGEAEVLVLAVQFAQLHGALRTDLRAGKPLPGREGLKQLGGAGTPMVAEFAPVLLGARLAQSPYAGVSLVADALDLRYRLPKLWERVHNLEVKASYAREVARRTRHVPATQAAYVDEQVAEEADGRVSWSRFVDLIDAATIGADPVAAARRELQAATTQFASPTRTSEHGMRGFYLRAPFPVIDRLEATVAYLAQALADFGDDATLDERRVKAVLILANPTQAVHVLRAYATWRRQQTSEAHPTRVELPRADAARNGSQDSNPGDFSLGQAREGGDAAAVVDDAALLSAAAVVDDGSDLDDAVLLPTVRLFVHLTQETIDNDCEGVGRVEGQPPITAQWVKHHLGGCRITVTPVLDLANQIPVDAWEIPQRQRHAVHLMTPADTFPYATNTSRNKQIDHTTPYDRHGPPGQSRIGNYGPMTVFHHRIKTHGGWHVVQPFPGIYLWRDPTGTATYLVDHTGTRRIGSAA